MRELSAGPGRNRHEEQGGNNEGTRTDPGQATACDAGAGVEESQPSGPPPRRSIRARMRWTDCRNPHRCCLPGAGAGGAVSHGEPRPARLDCRRRGSQITRARGKRVPVEPAVTAAKPTVPNSQASRTAWLTREPPTRQQPDTPRPQSGSEGPDVSGARFWAGAFDGVPRFVNGRCGRLRGRAECLAHRFQE